MLINCEHPSNRILTREFVEDAGGEFLHRFQWLNDDEIGELPPEWNHLVLEYQQNPNAKLYHHTLGSPGFNEYRHCESAEEWNSYLLNALNMEGEQPHDMVRRARFQSFYGRVAV